MAARPEPARATGRGALALACGLLVACGGDPEPANGRTAEESGSTARTTPAEAGSLARAAPEEIRWDLENLGYEIADLEALVESGAEAAPGTDPAATLAGARAAYEAALDAVARGETDRAADSLEVAASRVEAVKRGLGLAEEWGEPFGADSIPVTVPEDLES